jgi:hypothetical protein
MTNLDSFWCIDLRNALVRMKTEPSGQSINRGRKKIRGLAVAWLSSPIQGHADCDEKQPTREPQPTFSCYALSC